MIHSNSCLCHIPDVLMAVICSYLALETKCRTLPLLSRCVKSLFQPSTCCRGHVKISVPFLFEMNVKATPSVVRSNALGRAPYMAFASSVEVDLDNQFGMIHKQKLYCWFMEALMSGVLESLDVTGLTIELMNFMNQLTSVQLKKIQTLRVSYPDGSYDCDWSFLQKCPSLQHFEIVQYRNYHAKITSPLSCLPNTLITFSSENFYYFDQFVNNDYWFEFGHRLQQPDYLPHLKKVTLIESRRSQLESVRSAITSETGLVRQITFDVIDQYESDSDRDYDTDSDDVSDHDYDFDFDEYY